MTATPKTDDNVIQRRRADDWKRPVSVPKPNVFDWREGDGVAFLDDKAYARVGAALSGARAITAILMQQEVDRGTDEIRDAGLKLTEVTTHGLFEALASCLEVADLYATGGNVLGTTALCSDDPEAKHLREAARDAYSRERSRRAVEHAERLHRAQAAKKEAA